MGVLGAALAWNAGCQCDGDGGGSDSNAGSETTAGSDTQACTTVGVFDLPGTGLPTTGLEAGTDDCAEVEVTVQQVVPTIVVLVDQSSSMNADFSGQSRWDAVYETLMDPMSGILPQIESDMRIGLALYSSQNGFEGGVCPMLTEVAPAVDNYLAIDAVYGPEVPIDETPTGESLDRVAAGLAQIAELGPKAIVLATDGEPDTCRVPNPQQGQAVAIAAAQNAYVLGIETYVISVGTDVGMQHLQEMANAGVGLDPQDPNGATFWQALNAQDLVDAFDQIIGNFVSCTFMLNGEVDLGKECDGTVLLDGVELECGVDWNMPDPSTLELLGGACDTLKDGEQHMLEASWPCDSVDIP